MYEDPNYFPLDVSSTIKSKMKDDWINVNEFATLENASFTHSLKSDASAPLRMTNIFDVADFHVKTMAAYSSYAPISNDVQRIMKMPGVTEAIESSMGKQGLNYLKSLMQSIATNKVRNGDIAEATLPLQSLINAYKRQAVSFNVSTAIKQPLSIFRALNEIDGKYLLKAGKITKHDYNRIYNDMIDRSGVAKMKMLGYSDVGFGKSLRSRYDENYVNDSGIIRGALSDSKAGATVLKGYDKITEAGMWLAGKADEMTWVKIWRACELEVADKHPGLSGKEYTEKVTQRFNTIIGRTQVVDTVLDTSPFSKNKYTAILAPFMNEPVKALGTMISAGEMARDSKPGGNKKLAKAICLVAFNNLLLEPIITTLMSMWRDEEDDTESFEDFSKKFIELYLGINFDEKTTVSSVLTSNAVGGLFGFPILQIFYDTYSNTVNGYSNEKIDTAAISNLLNKSISLFSSWSKPKEERAKTRYKLLSDFIGAAAAAKGIPLPTLRKQFAAMYRSAIELTDNYTLQWEYNKVLYNLENASARSQKGFYDIMAAAYKAGDTEAYENMRRELNTIISGTPASIKANSITDAIEKRGGEVKVGSDLWYVDIQSRFRLPTANNNTKVEQFLTKTYLDLEKAGIDDSNSVFLTDASAYSYEIEKDVAAPKKYDYSIVEKDGKEYYKMSSAGYAEYLDDVGLLSYQVLRELSSSSNSNRWEQLTTEQKQWAIEQVYAYAKAKYKKDFNSSYEFTSNYMKDLYKSKAGQSEIAKKILKEAKSKDFKK
jgi:hypothetical protein